MSISPSRGSAIMHAALEGSVRQRSSAFVNDWSISSVRPDETSRRATAIERYRSTSAFGDWSDGWILRHCLGDVVALS